MTMTMGVTPTTPTTAAVAAADPRHTHRGLVAVTGVAALSVLLVASLFVSFQTAPPSWSAKSSSWTAARTSLDWNHLLLEHSVSHPTNTSDGSKLETTSTTTVRSDSGHTSSAEPQHKHMDDYGMPPLSTEHQQHQQQQHTVPRHILFTYKHNILQTQRPRKAYANLMATIDAYRVAWNMTATSQPHVWFLDDVQCREAIALVEPRLVPHFDSETTGGFKADICRAAALTLRGGYYFDVDVEVVTPYVVPEPIRFCAPTSQANPETFFQAFMAVAPQNPVVIKSLEYMLRHYDTSDDMYCYLLGPKCLYMAYANMTGHPLVPDATHYKFLYEFRLKHEFPNVPRQPGGGLYCNYGVQDVTSKVFHFYSRFIGSSTSCSRRTCDEYGCSPVVFDNDDVPPTPPS